MLILSQDAWDWGGCCARAASGHATADYRHDDGTFLYAFDLIELNGDDLRAIRKADKAAPMPRPKGR